MTGVEILAMEKVVTEYAFNWQLYLITLAVAVVLCGIIGIVAGIPYDMWTGALVGMGIGLICGIIVGQVPAWTTLPKESETRYKVAITDEVKMSDFTARYEILDQEGRIYTVREIAND